MKNLIRSFGLMFLLIGSALAQDITAVNFEGDVIGKVIPDGTAVNFNNEIIGQLTADGFLVNSKGNIVGGIVPQGFAVSNDHKYLGKVSGDGTVRLPSGKKAGKVLPNGLVVDEFFEVIGSVLSTGIVYNDLGNAVGRLAGNGQYINFDGQNVGFVSPSGYAYKQTETGYVLDGKLISSKMVVSLEGDFVGSVAPGGQVVDFESNFIGKLHANGYVYNDLGRIIGRTVNSAYAFDNSGSYLGFVSYNGEVLNKGKVVAKLRADNRVVDLKNNVIGFIVDMNAVAVAEDGKYLGYVAPAGEILKGREVVGKVGARGLILGKDGTVLGRIVIKGPVFDYLGNLKAEAVPNGQVVSFDGSTLGFMKGAEAFDYAGFMMGRVMQPLMVMNSKQDILAMTGIGSDFSLGNQRLKISPLGYVWTTDNVLTGQTLSFSPIYTENGNLVGFIDVNGQINARGFEGLKLKSAGVVLDAQNNVTARQIDPVYTILYDNKPFVFSQMNLLYNDKGKVIAKILPEYDVVHSEGKDALMPVVGNAGQNNGIVLGVRGDVVGYADEKGRILNAGKDVGRLVAGGIALNKKNVYVGEFVSFKPIVNLNCDAIGVVGLRGDARSGRDNVLGKTLLNGRVVSETGQNVGYVAVSGPVYGFDGKLLGVANEKGQVLDDEQQVVGCLNSKGRLYDANSVLKGHIYETNMVMSFENKMIGRVNLKDEFVNNGGEIEGFLTPDGTVVNEKGKKLGLLFEYKVAFDKSNNFIGYVTPDGVVYDDKGDIFGNVMSDGLIVSKSKAVGYALYDLYIYDEDGNVVGYLTKNGTVMNFSGQNLGKADRGFLVSKDGRLIGRGNRDYFVRDKQNNVLGEVLLSNKVVAHDGNVIASVSSSGDVRDETGRILGTARPLQYYVVKEGQAPKWSKQPEAPVEVNPIDVPETEEEEMLPLYNQKVVGIVVSPNGDYLGKLLENGDVVDDDGHKIGTSKDGVVTGEDNEVIGVVQGLDEPEPETKKISNMFIPSNAYSTSNEPTDLGPGGGYGPNERYDPMRSYILNQMQNARVGDVRVGKLTSDIKSSSINGYQDNWDNANFAISSWRVDMSEMILADKPIPAVLARTIMEGSAGSGVPVTAIVERNVYAEDGRNIVIPAGSRVMGESSGMSGGGSSGGAVRVNITWTRLIKPDGSAFEFAQALTGDAQGRAGALGYLDEQLLKRYALPVTTDVLSNALAYMIPGGKTTTSDSGSQTQDSRAAAAEQIRQSFLNDMQNVLQDILARKTSIEAVTYVPAGTRLIIYPKMDLWLRTLDRERSEAYAKQEVGKSDKLIDDSDPMGSIHSSSRTGGGDGSSSTSSSSSVVYSGDDAGVQATPLIDDAALAQKRQQQQRQPQMGAVPPPPPSTTAAGSSSSKSSDSSSGALF